MSSIFEVIILLDKSGSMNVIREATVKGINDFIDEVQKTPGEGYWTLIQFDDRSSAHGAGEEFPHVTFARKMDAECPRLTLDGYRPRGSTALVDAVCLTINRIKDRLKDTDPAKRPRIMFVIVTDGEENSSKEFTSDQLREMTAEAEAKLGWKFLYLGANQDEFSVASKYIPTSAGFNFAGLQGCVSSGMMGSGVVATQHTNRSAIPFAHNAAGVRQAMISGSVGVRAWKADGRPEYLQFLSSAEPDAGQASVSGCLRVGN